MTLRWLVYSAGEELGPWSASRIREELRSGRIDAFDMVASEGSQIKRPLVEVDEIFENSRIQAAALMSDGPEHRKASSSEVATPEVPAVRTPLKVVNKTAKDETPRNLSPIATKLKPENKSEELNELPNHASTSGPERPRVFEALAAKDAVHSPKKSSKNRESSKQPATGFDSKRYIIWRPDRVSQGPLSSREILLLWHSKKIAADSMVQRIGIEKRIGIAQFVRFYERNQHLGVAVLNEVQIVMRRHKTASWWLVSAIVLAAIIIGGAFFYSSTVTLNGPILENDTLPGNADSTSGSIPSNVIAEPPEKPLDQLSSVPAVGQSRTSLEASPPIKPIIKTKPPIKPKVRVARPSRSSYQSPTKTATPSPVVSPIPVARPVQAVPSKQRTAVTAPVASKAQYITPALADGATVTLTGYRFNIAQLNACDLKCKIPMTGPRGPVIAVFFKEAFGQAFAGKSSGATIVGTVRKDAATGAVQILVQQVK